MPQGIQTPGSAPADQIAQFRSDGITAATGLRVPFFEDSFSPSYGLPETRLVNMISESTPIREERPFVPLVGLREVRYSRPGLVSGFNPGTGPIRGLFTQPGVFGGVLFIVSGTSLYRADTGANIGAIPGRDIARFAASNNQLVIAAGGVAYLYDGTNFGPLGSPNLPAGISDVAYLAGQFLYAIAGTTMFYYSQVNDAANINGLNFASTESSAAPIVAFAVLNDALLIFTGSTVEIWTPTGNADTPFQPSEGRGYQRGCVARGSLAFCDNAIFWVGDNQVVYRSDNANDRVSSSSIESKIRLCTDLAAITSWVATFEGHEFYVLNLPGVGTYAYDASRIGETIGGYGQSATRGQWGEWQSYAQATFRGQVTASQDGTIWVGDNTTNDVWEFTVGAYTDGTDPMVRVGSCFIKVESGNPRCLNLVLHCVMGVGNATRPGVNPVVEMRYSDDLGRTFCRWRQAQLGAVGVYSKQRAFWQRLGLFRAPGRLIEVRCSDPVNVTYSHIAFNEPRPAY